MKDNLLLTGTIGIADIPFITSYEEVKKRLSIRLNNKERLLTSRPGAVYEPFLDFAVTCHIDVSDLVGTTATCMVKKGLMKYIGVGQERMFADAKENGVRTRPGITMPIEDYMGGMGFMCMEGEPEHKLMIASTEGLMYGAGVILYPGFLEQISGGKDLFLIPSSIHEWLYLEDNGGFTAEELTELLRAVNREVVEEEEVLADEIYYYDWEKKEMRRA